MGLNVINKIKKASILSIEKVFENIKLNNGIGYTKDKNVITFNDYGITAFYMKDENGWALKFHEIDGGKIYYGVNWLGGLIEEIKVGLDSLNLRNIELVEMYEDVKFAEKHYDSLNKEDKDIIYKISRSYVDNIPKETILNNENLGLVDKVYDKNIKIIMKYKDEFGVE